MFLCISSIQLKKKKVNLSDSLSFKIHAALIIISFFFTVGLLRFYKNKIN